MAIRTTIEYQGNLHCEAVHGPSKDKIFTDAPVDNQGKGEHFSPTDLVGAAMGSCMLTIMGIAAKNRGIQMEGATAVVDKEMSETPHRHIAKLHVHIRLPATIFPPDRKILEKSAGACPVAASMGERTQIAMEFEYV
jgi:putative redox protein